MGLEGLATQVDALDLEVSPEGLREAIAVRDRLDARIAVATGGFDAAGLGDIDAALSTQGWLRHRAGCDHKAAGRLTALARRLHRFDALRVAAVDGALTAGQLAIITACVPARHFDRFDQHQTSLVEDLTGLSIDATRIVLEAWLAKADALDERAPTPEEDNEVHLARTLDGRGELRGSLDADHTAALEAALRIADCRDFGLSTPQRRAEGLDTIIRYFLDHQNTTGARHRPHVNVVMTYEEFCRGLGGTYLETGQPVGAAEAGVLRCDSILHRLLIDSASTILDYGRATREWPVDVFNAILARDQGCRFPGCCAPATHCDVHHVLEWDAHGGPTSLTNLTSRQYIRHSTQDVLPPIANSLEAGNHQPSSPKSPEIARSDASDPSSWNGSGPFSSNSPLLQASSRACRYSTPRSCEGSSK